MERIYLGWAQMPLESATKWLVERFGSDMEGVLVALPGARSGRALAESLARAGGSAFRPPEIVTAGALSDELLELEGAPAGRLLRTIAWQRALQEMDPRALSRLVAKRPGADDQASWMRLAEEVRGLFGEVAAEGLDFERVASDEMLEEQSGERRRWLALAEAQSAMTQHLHECDHVDPHLGRLEAIAEGRVRAVRAVVLVGVVEINALLRRALEACPAEQVALIFAPDDLSAGFDERGALVPAFWIEHGTSLQLDEWCVVDRPDAQAQAALGEIANWEGTFSAERISIGLADAEVTPFLRRHLAEHGVVGRDAAGTPIIATAPVRLLEALGRFLGARRFVDFATLVRHPDIEAALRARVEGLEPIGALDEYHERHLPGSVDGDWLVDGSSSRDRNLHGRVEALWQATKELLGDLWGEQTQPFTQALSDCRLLLGKVYAGTTLTADEDRGSIDALGHIGLAMGEIDALPASFDPKGSASDAIELLRRTLRGAYLPPPAARAGEPTIELLGWLELPLDDAPALIVTGFEDGRVPESVRGDAYLPNHLRRNLGLVDNDGRLARDLYATELLRHSRDRILFVSGRRNLAGDPQVPSRIVFHCEESDVPARVRRFLEGSHRDLPRIAADEPRHELPRDDGNSEIERISVTSFRLFLRSPYQYYLEKVARIDRHDDDDRELDPLAFGNLAHAALQAFGEDKRARDERNPEKIARFLCAELRKRASLVYGDHPLPAVHLQLAQLELRLTRFAEVQAKRRASGWCIAEVEWSPTGGHLDYSVDGRKIEIAGYIDRIDYHAERKEWSIWDYKTGESKKSPLNEHRAMDSTWRDLQLPLYCLLAHELIGDEPPAELGYIAICGKQEDIGFAPVKDWSRPKGEFDSLGEGIAAGIEAADDVVRAIRSGDFFTERGFDPSDKIERAIGGLDLIGAGEEEE